MRKECAAARPLRPAGDPGCLAADDGGASGARGAVSARAEVRRARAVGTPRAGCATLMRAQRRCAHADGRMPSPPNGVLRGCPRGARRRARIPFCLFQPTVSNVEGACHEEVDASRAGHGGRCRRAGPDHRHAEEDQGQRRATMGVRESSGALSFTLGDGKYAGFHVEVCQQVLADIQKAQGMPSSKSSSCRSPRRTASRWCRTAPSTSNAARPPTTPRARRTWPSR